MVICANELLDLRFTILIKNFKSPENTKNLHECRLPIYHQRNCWFFWLTQEAMDEVDVDGSDSIDFFEYICVANMLMHKTGSCEKHLKSYN